MSQDHDPGQNASSLTESKVPGVDTACRAPQPSRTAKIGWNAPYLKRLAVKWRLIEINGKKKRALTVVEIVVAEDVKPPWRASFRIGSRRDGLEIIDRP